MDIDNIKKVWQETTVVPSITDCEIQQMLDNRGKSAFEKLLRYEKIGLIICFLCIPMSFLFKDVFLIIFYLCSIVLAVVWQIYKYRFLKKIDIVKMGILQISASINRYKKYLYKEIILGFIWAFLFCLAWLYKKVDQDISKDFLIRENSPLIIVGVFIALILFIFSFAYTLYRLLYLNNIKVLEKSIQEVEEFEKENN